MQALQVNGNNVNPVGHGYGQHHQRPHVGNLVEGEPRPAHRTQGQQNSEEGNRQGTQGIDQGIETNPQQQGRRQGDQRRQVIAILNLGVVAVQFEQVLTQGINLNAGKIPPQPVPQGSDRAGNLQPLAQLVGTGPVLEHRQSHITVPGKLALDQVLVRQGHVPYNAQVVVTQIIQGRQQVLATVNQFVHGVEAVVDQGAHRHRRLHLAEALVQGLHGAQGFTVENITPGGDKGEQGRAAAGKVGLDFVHLRPKIIVLGQDSVRTWVRSRLGDPPTHSHTDDDRQQGQHQPAFDQKARDVHGATAVLKARARYSTE